MSSRNLSSWLPGLIGPVDLQSDGESLNSTRSAWNFIGVTIVDDAENDALSFTFGGDLSTATGTVAVAHGGTGLTASGTSGYVLTSNGSAFVAAQIVDANVSSSAAIAGAKLAAATTSTYGVVKLANNFGGTGALPTVVDLTITSQAQGDILYFNGTNWVRLAAGTSGQFLKTLGGSANPAWATAPGSATSTGFIHVTSGTTDGAARAVDVSSADITGTLAIGSGGTGLTASGTSGFVLTSNGSAFVAAQIVDANVSSSAAIAGTKLAAATTSTQGAVKLASDLGGTGALPTVLSLTGVAGTLAMATTAAILLWASSTSAPTIKQADNTAISATAQGLTIQAQNATGVTSIGGQLTLTSGTGTTSAGSVVLQVGGTTEMVVSATRVTVTPVGLAFAIATVAPTFYQLDDTTNSVVGQPLAIHAQNCTGTTATGGILALASGTGTTIAGAVTIATGATTQLTLTTTLSTFANPVAVGTTPATTGSLRFPNAVDMVVCRNGSNAANCVALSSDSSNELFIGGNASFASQFAIIRQYASSTQYWGIGSTTYASIQSSRWEFNSIKVGGVSGSNSFAWGSTSKSWPSDADYTLLNTEYCNPVIFFTSGTIAAGRNAVFPVNTGAVFYISNATGQTLTIKTPSGTGPTVATGSGIVVACDGTNYIKIG